MNFFGIRWTKKESITIALVAACVVYGMVYSYLHHPFHVFLSQFALVAAAVAALIAALSLKYTRDTVRPFLSFKGTINLGGPAEKRTLAFPITNTGPMPADDVRLIIDPFGIDEEIGLENTSKRYESLCDEKSEDEQEALVLFPNQTWQHVLNLDLTTENNKKWWEWLLNGNIKLRITILYRSSGRKYKTIHTIAFDELSLSADKKHLHALSVKPQSWA
jgi:hypothetical protein